MLYGVLGNVITIIEEYEQRELAQNRMQHYMSKSNIYIPDQSHKDMEDVSIECWYIEYIIIAFMCK